MTGPTPPQGRRGGGTGRQGKVWGALFWALGAAFWPALPSAPAHAQEQMRRFDIPAGPLDQALLEFARQAGLEVVLPSALLEGYVSAGVRGAMTPDQALARLLEGAPLRGEVAQGAVRLERQDQARARRPPLEPALSLRAPLVSEDVVVVGASLRTNYPEAYPLSIYTAQDIARTGAVRVEQFIGTLTQNLGSRIQHGVGAGAALNSEAVNGIDLRGLGVGASLVLVNGRRLPLASEGRTADISFLPLNAIARIEVLTDAAPVRFGADAVGGVVNFVLGEEGQTQTQIDYGAAGQASFKEGGLGHAQSVRFSQGAGFFAFSYRNASALLRQDRDFAASAAPGVLTPQEERASLVGQIQYEPRRGVVLSADLLAGWRAIKTGFAFPEQGAEVQAWAKSAHWLFGASAEAEISPLLRARLDVTRAHYETHLDQRFQTAQGPQRLSADTDYRSFDVRAMIEARAQGPTAEGVRLGLGLGRLTESFQAGLSAYEAERGASYGFFDLEAPLDLGAWAKLVHLSLGARFTAYDQDGRANFGGRLTPRAGISWALSDELRVRASYGEAFRAPALIDLDPQTAINVAMPLFVDGRMRPVLGVFGASPNIEAERARTFTAGLDVTPDRLRGLSVRATYFRVLYEGRLSVPDPSMGIAALSDPERYRDILYETSDVALIASILNNSVNAGNGLGVDLTGADGAQELAALAHLTIFDNRLRNIEDVEVAGFDLDLAYGRAMAWGNLAVSARMSRLFDYDERLSANAPKISVLNTVLRPVDLRVRAALVVERRDWEAVAAFNYVTDYANPYGAAETSVPAWRTFDLRIAFDLPSGESSQRTRLGLSINNVFDEPPPYVSPSNLAGTGLRSAIGFDPANANPVGRFVMLDVTRTW